MSDFYKLKTKKNGKEYVLNACTQDTEQNITGTKNFSKLTVNSKNVVTSINGLPASEDGNVQLGTEKSTFNKVVFDTGYFSIGTDKTYSFDLTGSDLENVSKENVNIRLVAKVTTAHNGFQVGDIAQLSTTFDANAEYGDLGVSSYIGGNTLYLYSGSRAMFSVTTASNLQPMFKSNVQIKAVLTAFIPSDGGISFMPDYSSKVSLSTDTVYTAPCDCLVCVFANDISGGDSIVLLEVQDSNGNVILTQKNRFCNGSFTSCASVNLPIPKGTTFKAIARSTGEAYVCYFPYK